jgi:hypothetical protein
MDWASERKACLALEKAGGERIESAYEETFFATANVASAAAPI